MLKCPKCNKEMPDGSKFCSECASPLIVEGLVSSAAEKEEEALTEKNAAEEEIAVQEESEPTEELAEEPTEELTEELTEEPTGEPETKKVRKGNSRKGVFICLVLAVLAVVALYVFYEDLGFGILTKSDNNVVLYVKDGELFYNDLTGNAENQITKDLAGAIEDPNDLMAAVKLSSDGKTLFYPDRAGAGTGGYSLYCTKPGTDMLPVKLGNNITWYDISDTGNVVYYITLDKILYRHDLNTKTKIASDVIQATVGNDGARTVYLTQGGLYWIEGTKTPVKISSDVSAYCASETITYVYYADKEGFYCFDSKKAHKIASAQSKVLAYCDEMLVISDKEEFMLIAGTAQYVLDCGKTATDFCFDPTGGKLYYLEGDTAEQGKDAYCVEIKDQKPQATVLCDSEVESLVCATPSGIVCLKDVKDDLGDLYINGKCFGYEVSSQMIKWDGAKGVAFLADCDAASGVLTVFDGKNTSSLRGDVAAFAYTAKGEIVFLCDVGQNSGKGDVCRMGDGNAVVVADGVTHLIIPI